MNLKYILNDTQDGLIVMKYVENLEGELAIPSEYEIEGKVYPVTEIRERAFEECSKLSSITIPDSLTKKIVKVIK